MRKRVLVVDDDAGFVEELSMSLCLDGYDVIPMTDPRQALRTAITARPDVVLLDVSMPGGNGFQIASEMASFSPLSFASIIIMTGFDKERHSALMRQCGFREFLAKPFCYHNLLSIIEKPEH